MTHPPLLPALLLLAASAVASTPARQPHISTTANATTANATTNGTTTANATNSVSEIETIPTAEANPWRFKGSLPAWTTWITGTVGINGVKKDVDVGFKDIVDNVDMIFSFRGEIDKGPFGITTDLVYLGISDGASSGTPVSSLDFELEQTVLDIGFHWRVVDKPEGSIDVLSGFRYINLQQSLAINIDESKAGAAVSGLVDNVQTGLQNGLTNGQIRDLVAANVRENLGPLAENPNLPIAPFNQEQLGRRLQRIQRIVDAHRDELRAAILANNQPQIDAIKSTIQKEAVQEVGKIPEKASRTDDWFDPYIGLRGRWNINRWLYLTARGDVGGFGVGSDLTWQAEGAVGLQLTRHITAEAGYRALSIDYNQNGLLNDTLTHGAQVTLGYEF